MDKLVIPVSLSVVLTKEDIDDIVCCMVENGGYGVGYWCDEISAPDDKWLGEFCCQQISLGGEIIFHTIEPFDDDETEYYTLNLEKFINGVQLYAKNFCAKNDCFMVDNGELRVDTCNVDALIADAIAQYALFGEVVYG